jgi:hypothetical protein
VNLDWAFHKSSDAIAYFAFSTPLRATFFIVILTGGNKNAYGKSQNLARRPRLRLDHTRLRGAAIYSFTFQMSQITGTCQTERTGAVGTNARAAFLIYLKRKAPLVRRGF